MLRVKYVKAKFILIYADKLHQSIETPAPRPLRLELAGNLTL